MAYCLPRSEEHGNIKLIPSMATTPKDHPPLRKFKKPFFSPSFPQQEHRKKQGLFQKQTKNVGLARPLGRNIGEETLLKFVLVASAQSQFGEVAVSSGSGVWNRFGAFSGPRNRECCITSCSVLCDLNQKKDRKGPCWPGGPFFPQPWTTTASGMYSLTCLERKKWL